MYSVFRYFTSHLGCKNISFIESRYTDIVALISEYAILKKVGRLHGCFCPFPFHDDYLTPSFKVSEDKQAFHCFGCGKGGDAFAFLQLKENLTFPEAVEKLAIRAGVKLAEDWNGAPRREDRAE